MQDLEYHHIFTKKFLSLFNAVFLFRLRYNNIGYEGETALHAIITQRPIKTDWEYDPVQIRIPFSNDDFSFENLDKINQIRINAEITSLS